MSLYEQFHSEINKTFMFNIIKDELKKEGISDISEYYNEYLTFFNPIFESNDFDEIEMINKELLNYSISYFTNKFKPSNDLNSLLQQREEMILNLNNSNESNLSSSINEVLNFPLNQIEVLNKEPHLPHENINKESFIQETIQELNQPKNLSFALLSSKRSNINSSRYNYRIDLKKQSIDSKMIHKISKLILPIEDNYIFDMPVITLMIPELDFKIHMQQNTTIDNKNISCGVYYPVNEHTIQNKTIEKITIDIRDITETKFPINDILKINIIELDKNNIKFTCSNIHRNNFKNGDNIKIINIHSNDHLKLILDTPFKIKKIDKNIITCKIDGYYDYESYNDIDMKLMNMTNQNILYFN